MTFELKHIKEVCSVIDEELSILRHVLEDVVSRDFGYNPMMTFFKNSTQRYLALTIPKQQDFSQTLARMAEAFYLYPPLQANCAIISLDSHVETPDGALADCLQVFVISADIGVIIKMPYTIGSNNSVIWNEDHFSIDDIINTKYEGLTKEMINLFFMITHLDSSPYTVQECMSYLTYVGLDVKPFDALKIVYYDMTST